MMEEQTGTSESSCGQPDPLLDQVRADFEKLSLEKKFFALAQLGWKTAEQSVEALVEGSAQVSEEFFGSLFGSKTSKEPAAEPSEPAESPAGEEGPATS